MMKHLKNEFLTDTVSSNSPPDPIVIINCALNALLMQTSIIGNALVLAAILRTPSLRSPSTVFLCSLAVSDFLVGLVVQPVFIVDALRESHSLALAEDSLTLFLCGVSLCTISAISLDRFMALHYHMRYPHMMTTKRAIYTSATLWIKCLLLSCISFWNLKTYVLTVMALIAFCLVISTFSYIGIYRIVLRHQLQIHAQQQAARNVKAEHVHDMDLIRSRRSAVNTFIYYICMIFCYSPVLISTLFIAISGKRHRTETWALADTVVYMNSSINPLLYCWRLRELRAAVLKTLQSIFCKQREQHLPPV